MSRAVFLERSSLDLGDLDLDPLRDALPGLVFHETTAPYEVLPRMREAECVLVNKLVLDADTIAACPNLRLICIIATGTNNVALQMAAERGVTVVNCRGYGTASLTQHVFTLMLALTRSLLPYVEAVRAGRWGFAEQFCLLDHPIAELDGRVLGIVGYGELGRSVARLGECLGMSVRVAERPHATAVRPGRVPLESLLAEADVLSLHCPLTAETRGLIGERELARMKRTAILINTARGGIVEEAALAAALRGGVIAGAGVDVLTEEPPAAGNPLLAPDIPNLLVTPHCAWGSREARQRIIDQTVENIRAWRRGQSLREVTAGGRR